MKLGEQISTALSELIGLPLWKTVRTMNMEMFDFGARVKRLNRKGEEVEVGEFALHVQCPWRIVGPEGVVVASEDRNYPEDETSDWQEFDSDNPSRCETRIADWLRRYSSAPLMAKKAEADDLGGFRLFLEKGYVLEAFPAHSLRGEYSEYWRLFQPLSETRHFVVTGRGVEK